MLLFEKQEVSVGRRCQENRKRAGAALIRTKGAALRVGVTGLMRPECRDTGGRRRRAPGHGTGWPSAVAVPVQAGMPGP